MTPLPRRRQGWTDPPARAPARAQRESCGLFIFFLTLGSLGPAPVCLPHTHPFLLPRASLLAETPAAPPPASLLSLLPSNNPHTTMREVISVHIGQAGECVGLERGAGRGARTPIVFVLSEGGGAASAPFGTAFFSPPPPPPPPQPPFPALCPPALRPVGRSRSWTGRAGGWRPVRVGTQPLGGDRFGRRRRGGGGGGKAKKKTGAAAVDARASPARLALPRTPNRPHQGWPGDPVGPGVGYPGVPGRRGAHPGRAREGGERAADAALQCPLLHSLTRPLSRPLLSLSLSPSQASRSVTPAGSSTAWSTGEC